jgi:5-methylcytosine-specific restriction endonuclease McrA
MGRIRSIHPGLFTDESFITASMASKVLIVGLWTEADDSGVFEWKPIRLKMRLFPADNVTIDTLLEELSGLNIVRQFEVEGKQFGAIRNFRKWQRPKAPQCIHPCPNEIAEYTGLVAAMEAPAKPERGTALARLLHERQNGLCHYCEAEITFYRKRPNSLHIDHRIPISRGGSDEISNLAASCRQCNLLKADMTDQEFKIKFAPRELRERHLSPLPKGKSASAKRVSHNAKTRSGVATIQREDGGDKEREESILPQPVSQPRARGEIVASMPHQQAANDRGPAPIVEIIRAFDDARADIWGEKQRRQWPAQSDRITAQGWIDAGIKAALVADVAKRQFEWMLSNGRDLPRTLKIIDADVRSASAEAKRRAAEGPFDPDRTQWEARANGYRDKGLWVDSWGNKPGERGCRMPRDLQERALEQKAG